MITVDRLSFSFRAGIPVLTDVSFRIARGRLACLLGPNGSGKTTLLKCMNYMIRPTSGGILIDGRSVDRMPRRELARSVAYVPQDHQAFFPFSVLDIVLLGRNPHIGMLSSPKSGDEGRCLHVLTLLGIEDLAHRRYTELSGGERKLCLLARALASEAAVLLLDEPTAHLDIDHQGRMISILRTLIAREAITVLMTVHDPNMARLISDQVILLRKGHVVGGGMPSEVLGRENLENVYGCGISFVREGSVTMIYPSAFNETPSR